MSAHLTPAKIRASLRHLDAELYDETIPFEATAARLLSVTDTVAQMIASNLGRLPGDVALLIAKAQGAVLRRDLLAARDYILDALAGLGRR